jgi:signal transduction histidine kinase
MSEAPAYAARPGSGPGAAGGPAGGRHGRPPAPVGTAEPAARSRLTRLAVVPAAVMAVLAAAVVVFVLLAQSGVADAATFGVLVGAGVLGVGVLIGAARAAGAESREAAERQAALAQAVARGRGEVQAMVEALKRGERVEQPYVPRHTPGGDDHARLAYEISVAQFEAKVAFAQAARLVQDTDPGTEDRVEVFVNLARRLQSLAHRQLSRLEALENEVEDPELLKGLFHVDHMATRIRRHAENVAVLGGSVSRRQWTRPVTLMEVLRSSISEVEQYSRVKLVPPVEGSLRGHAVADVIHLLAELLENATSFSDPGTNVLLRAQRVTAGLAIEVEDRGLGMSHEEQARLNTLLTQPDRIDLGKLLVDGRIGLYVVSELARRHGIAVRLQSNIYGGIQAVLVLPHAVIGDETTQVPTPAAAQAPVLVPPTALEPVALQPGGDADYMRPRLDTAEPMAQRPAVTRGRSIAASEPVEVQHSLRQGGAVQGPVQHGFGGAEGEARAGRPPLPQRQAQEHLAPQLRDVPSARPAGTGPDTEHDPGLMAAFRRGFDLADETPADGSADDSR